MNKRDAISCDIGYSIFDRPYACPRATYEYPDGRRVICALDGTIRFYINGSKFHNDWGQPAVIDPSGQCEYWYNGVFFREGHIEWS